MKKLFVFIAIVAIFCSANMFAQDVIFRHDGVEIKAKVFEISDQQIKYKAFDNQDGPTRVVFISNVKRIVFENGTEEIFDAQTPHQTRSQTPVNPPFSKLKDEFMSISKDKEMSEFFLANNFPDYYDSFRKARKMQKAGNALLATGAGLGACSLLSYGFFSFTDLRDLSTALAITGGGFVLASIPVIAIAGTKKKSIKRNFARNELGLKEYSHLPELNFGLISGGVGFTLNF